MTEIGEIPEEWKVKSLDEMCEVITKGTTPTTYGYEFVDEGINFIKIESIDNTKGILLSNTFSKITEECHKRLSRSILEENDILFAIAGATVGKCALVNKKNIPANTNQALAIIRLKKSVNTKFIFQTLRSNIIQNKIDNIKTNTAQPNLNLKQIGDFKVPIPSINEQEKIASILSTVDEQIDNVDALIEKNKELKKGLMQTLLTKGIGHTKFKKTEIGEIPEEWEIKSLGELGEFKNGINKSKEDFGFGCKFVNIQDAYSKNVINIKSLGLININENEKKIYQLEDGDIVLVRSSVKPEGVGYPILFRKYNDDIVVYCGFMIRYRYDIDKINPMFMLYSLRSYKVRQKVLSLSTVSANTNINQESYKEINIVLPTVEEQEKIASILLEVDNKIEEYENKKEKLKELKKGLMQQLLIGKIRIN